MKLTIRVFALAVVAAGFAAGFHSPQSAQASANHPMVSSAIPIPLCPPDGKSTCGIKQ
jgi:hypothetical protein